MICVVCSSTGFDSRNPLPDEYIKMIVRYANIVEKPPFNMLRAAAALKMWVHGSFLKHAPLDISACDVSGASCVVSERMRMSNTGAMALEPQVSHIAIACARGVVDFAAAASNEARFVYGLTTDLVRHHGRSVADALSVARLTWSRLHVEARAMVSDIDGVPGGVPRAEGGDVVDQPNVVEEIDEDPMDLEPRR
jgi:hypothetical protein